MSEPQWDELVRSPLHPDSDQTPRRSISAWVVVLVAAVIGLAVGTVAGLAEGAERDEAADGSSISTTMAPAEVAPVAPDGYVPVGDTSLGVIGSFGVDGHAYVIIGEAALSGADPRATPAFGAGRWALVDGDGAMETAVEIVDSLAPGMRLLEFEVDEREPDWTLAVWRGTAVEARDGCNGCGSRSVDRTEGESLVEFAGLPAEIPGPLRIELVDGLEVRIENLAAAEEWGYADWALVGDMAATARVAIEVEFVGTDDPSAEGDNPTMLVPYDRAPIQYGVGHPRAAPPFERAGSIRLTRVGEPVGGDNHPIALAVSWSVEWIHPVGEPIPLAGP